MDSTTHTRAERLNGLVRMFRKRAGLTQQQAAERAGISAGGLRDLEQGRVTTPRATTLRALASALELSEGEADQLLHAGRWSSGVRIQVLGSLEVLVDGVAVDLGSTTQRTLLGVLALSPNTVLSRDALIDAVWGGQPPVTVVELLQTHLSRLRRRLQPRDTGAGSTGLLVAVAGGYQLVVDDERVDVLAFGRLVARARQARDEGEAVSAVDLYLEATGLWRGRVLADLPALHAHPAAVALTREWQAVVVEYASVAADLGRHEQVLPLLQHLTEAEPLHEAAHAALMVALAGTGQQAAALTVYDQLRGRLADDLGADPGPELSGAHQRVLRQEITRREATPVSARRQLPPDLADFTGRHTELAELREQLPAASDGVTAIAITAIEGMAGVGKTRLAVHLAHQLLTAGRYGDVQLHVDLHGHADQPPADPATVLASFVHLLGVPGAQIPPDLDGRAALYRDQLHDQHALVLLDNAANEDQIRPLLPASPTNLVLITSRHTLALDGARTLALDVFTPGDAHALLVQIAGPDRITADPTAADRIIELCGRLPLAIALAARRLQTRPTWELTDLAARLEQAGDRLSELTAGSRQLRAVFDLSYQALDPNLRAVFRLLGLHPGDDVTADSVAALTDLTPMLARRRLDQLVDEHLLAMASADRYRLHDLLHDYARELAETENTQATRDAATTRLLDYYLHTVDHATQLLQPHPRLVTLTGSPPAHPTHLSTREDAGRWLDAERHSIIAAINLAASDGWPAHAWRLADALKMVYFIYGRIAEWERTCRIALAAARAAGEPAGEAAILTTLAQPLSEQGRGEEALGYLHSALELKDQISDRIHEVIETTLGVVCAQLSRFPEALRHTRTALSLVAGRDPYRVGVLRANIGVYLVTLGQVEEALDSYQAALTHTRLADNRHREVDILADIGDVYRRLGRHDESISHLNQALRLAMDNGLRRGEGHARYRLGQTYRELGQLDRALASLTEAVELARMVGGQASECEILVDLGAAHRDAGDLDTAHGLLRQALALAVETRDRYHEARALNGLAHIHHRAGHTDLAQQHRHQARTLFTELGTPEADQMPDPP